MTSYPGERASKLESTETPPSPTPEEIARKVQEELSIARMNYAYAEGKKAAAEEIADMLQRRACRFFMSKDAKEVSLAPFWKDAYATVEIKTSHRDKVLVNETNSAMHRATPNDTRGNVAQNWWDQRPKPPYPLSDS